jgi:hypothetical protein
MVVSAVPSAGVEPAIEAMTAARAADAAGPRAERTGGATRRRR